MIKSAQPDANQATEIPAEPATKPAEQTTAASPTPALSVSPAASDPTPPKTFAELKNLVTNTLKERLPAHIGFGVIQGLVMSLFMGMGYAMFNSESVLGNFYGDILSLPFQILSNVFNVCHWSIQLGILLTGGYYGMPIVQSLVRHSKISFNHLVYAANIALPVVGFAVAPNFNISSFGALFGLSAGLGTLTQSLKPLLQDPEFLKSASEILQPLLTQYKEDFVREAKQLYRNYISGPDVPPAPDSSSALESSIATPQRPLMAPPATYLPSGPSAASNAASSAASSSLLPTSAVAATRRLALSSTNSLLLPPHAEPLTAEPASSSALVIPSSDAASSAIAMPPAPAPLQPRRRALENEETGNTALPAAALTPALVPTEAVRGTKRNAAHSVDDASYPSSDDDSEEMNVDGVSPDNDNHEIKRSRHRPANP